MRRREFTVGIVGVVTWGMCSATAWSQQPGRTHRLAFVVTTTPLAKLNEADHMPYRALVEELRRRGYAEGRNLLIDRHTGEGRPERFPQLAREVVDLKPDVIVATTEELALALRAATTTIPIVVSSTDPVFKGLVKSLAQPGGNVTGVAIDVSLESVVKLFELIKEIDPRVKRVGFLTGIVSLGSRSEAWHASVRQRVAGHFGIEIVGRPLPGPWQEPQYRQAVAAMVQDGAQALVVDGIAANWVHSALTAELATSHRLPSISGWAEHVRRGGLAAYAVDLENIYRQMGGYVDRLLKGERASELPFALPTTLKFIVNVKAAAALGLDIPPLTIAQADEVIE